MATMAPPDAKKLARIYRIKFGEVYVLYVEKVEKKGRTKDEVDRVITWLTGYDTADIARLCEEGVDFEAFFARMPAYNPLAVHVTGLICGYRVEEIEDPVLKKMRQLDKLVDELAKGRPMEKVLRTG